MASRESSLQPGARKYPKCRSEDFVIIEDVGVEGVRGHLEDLVQAEPEHGGSEEEFIGAIIDRTAETEPAVASVEPSDIAEELSAANAAPASMTPGGEQEGSKQGFEWVDRSMHAQTHDRCACRWDARM